jgi:uncharacterized MAPEG superfamily protein
MTTHLPALVTLLTVVLMMWTIIGVGNARRLTGIKAPATTGNPDFERAFRVQMNTLEATALFLPCLWLASSYGYPALAGWIGVAWLVGRVWYAIAYARAADRRSAGFTLGALANIALLGIALWGVGRGMAGA